MLNLITYCTEKKKKEYVIAMVQACVKNEHTRTIMKMNYDSLYSKVENVKNGITLFIANIKANVEYDMIITQSSLFEGP